MDKRKLKLLKDLYYISSPSKREEKMSKFVCDRLDRIGISYEIDESHQIYSIKPNTPMLCAHMDQVGEEPTKIVLSIGDYIFGDKNIGADDKNGIWIVLNLLRKFPDISFIFSTQEEMGGAVDELLNTYPKHILKTIKYCLVFDRRGDSDIIGVRNNYCEKDLEEAIYEIGKDLNYELASGVFSDCDLISSSIPCVNISCGYYCSHSDDEFTDLDALENALCFGEAILNKVDQIFERSRPIYRYSGRNIYFQDEDFFCPRCYGTYFADEVEFDHSGTGCCPNCFVRLTTIGTTNGANSYPIQKYSKNTDIIDVKYCEECDIYSPQDFEECPSCGNELISYLSIGDKEEEDDGFEEEDYELFYCENCDEGFFKYELLEETYCPICNDPVILVQEGDEYEM